MVPLGLFMTTMGALGGPGMMGDPGGPVGPVGPQCWWNCKLLDGLSMLEPIDEVGGLIDDNNDMWDFSPTGVSTDGGDYRPQPSTTHVAECWWAPTLLSSGDIAPAYGGCG